MDAFSAAGYHFFMLLVDLILIVLLLAFAASGYQKGFVVTLGQLIGAVIGFLVARAGSPAFGAVVGIFLPGRAGLAQFIAFVLIFLIIDRLVGWVFGLAEAVIGILTRLPILSTINHLLGAIIGLAEGFVLIGSSVYLVLTFHLDPTLVTWLSGSVIAGYAERVFYSVLGILL